MFAYANINGVTRCQDSSSISKVPYHVICKENNIKPPSTRSTSQNFQTIVLIKIPTHWKTSWYPLPSLKRAINIHSKGPMEQYLCALEPHHGCLHKVKKVSWCPLIKEGQLSHKIGKCPGTPMFYTTAWLLFHQDFWPNLNFPLEYQIKLVLICRNSRKLFIKCSAS